MIRKPLTPDSLRPEKEIRKAEHRRTRQTIAIYALSLALTNSTLAKLDEHDMLLTEATRETVRGLLDRERCDIVPDETLETTIPELHEATNHTYLVPYPDEATYWQTLFNERNQIAEKLGLTIHSHRPALSALEQDLFWSDDNPTIPIDEYYQQTAAFLEQYDISLEFDAPDGVVLPYKSENGPYSYEQMVADDDETAKRNLYGIATAASSLPAELFEHTDLKEVRLISGVRGIAGYYYRKTPSIMYINVDYFNESNGHRGDPSASSTFFHELAHVWDFKTCGNVGAYIDTQFNDLNPEGRNYYRDGNSDNFLSINKANDLIFNDLYMQLYQAREVNDTKKAEAILTQIDATYDFVVTRTDYGSTSPVEDKATLLEDLLSGNHRELLRYESDIIVSKSELLLGRLYEEQPEVIEYLLRASQIY